MSITEIRDIIEFTNLQLVNKIKKMNSKIGKLNEEEKQFLDAMKKETWKRGLDNVS